MQMELYDPIHSSATSQQVLQKFHGIAAAASEQIDEGDEVISRTASKDDSEDEDETGLESEGPGKDATADKRNKRAKLARLKRKAKQRAYEFSGSSDLAGVLFLEISKITDLPPERNSKPRRFQLSSIIILTNGL